MAAKQEFKRGYRVIKQFKPGSDTPPLHGTVLRNQAGIIEIEWDGPGPEGGVRRYHLKDMAFLKISLAVP